MFAGIGGKFIAYPIGWATNTPRAAAFRKNSRKEVDELPPNVITSQLLAQSRLINRSMNIQSLAWLNLGQSPKKCRLSHTFIHTYASLHPARPLQNALTGKSLFMKTKVDCWLLHPEIATRPSWVSPKNRRPVRSKHRIRLWDCRHSLAADQDI